ncbi:potassium-transporting ATPase subunit KdpC [Alteriqipengyuania lutimaris]|uniref:Potassium-transporting ATPase KdpC subunit n=1 Tax=Alteriqipengyuania lutimaris TaxID=1538146 RepID=A0A395LFX8_9SPHN|nr:potassium-transporting ATPase subunit KdpC [Alteriqipengyuania lutimaris]MBB3035072.1 K+-transporting ATPase ATPase C chain [Alteriqipengyuania lutimaris]RDS75692.1 potassium-transporting ATPase subunit KdpC [Alteriqipengyuania lutimaris]
MNYLLPSLRLWLVTILVCVIGYAGLMLAFAQTVAPYQANGSILEVDGQAVGSELIAQDFSSPRYFWPRPSAADYDGMAAAGSNLSPTSADLAARAAETVARYGATAGNPVPADLVAASGGGLDPHISLDGALYQANRVAAARGLDPARVRDLIEQEAAAPGAIFAPERIVNVLQLNLALDRLEE